MKYLVLALSVLVLPFFFFPVPAVAGRVKDVQIEHLESIAHHLYGHYDSDQLKTRGSKFVPAESGYYIAVSTEVEVYDAAANAFGWVWCTSQFRQVGADRVEVAVTRCN